MWLCAREMWPGKYQRESVLPASDLEGADRDVCTLEQLLAE